MTFQGTGLSINAGSAAPGDFYTSDGQSNDGTGGSPVTDFPPGIPSSNLIQYRMRAFYKNNLWRLARENRIETIYPETLADSIDTTLAVNTTTDAVGPYIFFANRLLENSLLNGKEVLLQSNAIGGTFSNEWVPTTLSPPGTSPYSASFRNQKNARRRPNTTYKAKFVGQGESNCQSGLSFENDFTNASWVKVAITPTLNQGTDPLGGGTAQRLTETAANSAHSVTHAFSVPTPGIGGTAVPLVGTTVTYFLRIKTGTLATPRNWMYIEGNGGAVRVWFNTATGTVGTQTGGTGAMTNLGNGWWLAAMTFVFASGDARYGLANADNVVSYAGSVTADMLVYTANTNALAVRWFNDWNAHRTQWRIDTGIANLPFFFWNLSPTIPGPTAGSFLENWVFFRTVVYPQILLDPFTLGVSRAAGPFVDAPSNLHIAAGANDTEGEWLSGNDMGDLVLSTIYP